MNLFQIFLVVMAALIAAIWVATFSLALIKFKNKKEEYLVSDKMLSEDEKQKIRDEDFINFVKAVKYKHETYATAHGTVLNSKPYTFKDFINNQKLPSKLELTWEILGENNITIPSIIKDFEDGGIYPKDIKYARKIHTIKVSYNQMKNMEVIKLVGYRDYWVVIDKNYPIAVRFHIKPLTIDPHQNDLKLRKFDVDVTFQAGDVLNLNGNRDMNMTVVEPY